MGFNMVELNFIESLKTALDRLEIVNDSIDKFTLEKEELRSKIRKWLDMHQLIDFESFNSDKSKLWNMTIALRKKQTVDKEILKTKVTPQVFNEIVSETEYEVLTVKTVKHSKLAGAAIPAPRGSI